jgi:hypothetical protein
MIRLDVNNVTAQRTCTPLYERHQATPLANHTIDATETGDIYSGMVVARTGATTVGLADGTVKPLGLAAIDRNDVIDDFNGLDSAYVPIAVWVGGPDAVFEITSPAFDDQQTYTVPTNGTRELLYANASGQLSSVSSGEAVAELFQVVSDTKIIVRLLPLGVNAA